MWRKLTSNTKKRNGVVVVSALIETGAARSTLESGKKGGGC